MSIQSLIMSRPALARKFMTKASEGFHMKAGRKMVAETVETAIKRTKAYPDFLAQNGIDPIAALDPKRFADLPPMSKRNYIDRYLLHEICLDGDPSCGYTVEKSSGHSGKAYYWLRTPEEDALIPSYLRFAFGQVFNLHEVPTLMVVGLALGMWTAGEKMAQALRQLAASGEFKMTVASPGINIEEILETIRDVGPYYEQIVMFGYPPFIKQVIDHGGERGIDWPSLNLRIALGGEGFTEEWRRHLAAKIGADGSRDLLAVSGAYGAADLGMTVGREYPLTVLIRRLCEGDDALTRDLFGTSDIPNLFQYGPSACFAEEIDGELAFTTRSGIPLVRYLIGDKGGVLGFEHVIGVLADHGYDAHKRLSEMGYGSEDVWRLPFFHCAGRTDGAVFVGGLNLYPENVAGVLAAYDDPDIVGFKMATIEDEQTHDNKLLILLEHSDPALDEARGAEIAKEYKAVLLDGLKRVNREYRRLHEASPRLAEPGVVVHPAGHGPFTDNVGKIKRDYLHRKPSAA